MVASNFKCTKCKKVFEVFKKSALDDFPEHPECPDCKSVETQRVWGLGGFDVSLGIVGNASNSYSKEFVKHSSKMGSYKGKTIRKA